MSTALLSSCRRTCSTAPNVLSLSRFCTVAFFIVSERAVPECKLDVLTSCHVLISAAGSRAFYVIHQFVHLSKDVSTTWIWGMCV